MNRRIRTTPLALALGALLAGPAAAETVAAGDTLAPLSLEDQHGEPGAIDAETRGVLLSRDMDGGAFVREALAEDGAARLAAAGAVYVADVSGMPALIRRLFALPRMRERPYRVLLDTDGAPTATLPAEPGKATWLRLEGLRVVEVRILGSTAEVLQVLGVAPAGATDDDPATP